MHSRLDRRRFLHRSAGLGLASVAVARAAVARVPSLGNAQAEQVQAIAALEPKARRLAFQHTHTGEHLSLVYAVGDEYLPTALITLDHLLRDHYSGTVGHIDPGLFDLLHGLGQLLGNTQPYQVISAFRCESTNRTLRETRGGGVAFRSLHMVGQAIDIRLPGVSLADLRDAAVGLRVGGVGYYPREQFVHVDTGRVRRW